MDLNVLVVGHVEAFDHDTEAAERGVGFGDALGPSGVDCHRDGVRSPVPPPQHQCASSGPDVAEDLVVVAAVVVALPHLRSESHDFLEAPCASQL